MKTISLKISDSVGIKLSRIAEKRGTSKSELIRDAVEQIVANNTVCESSCLALAPDLIGCVEGPKDLSSNKIYMRGFGK